MPKPIKRREFLRRLRAFDWRGPDPASKHPIMVKSDRTIHIPNLHGSDLDWTIVKKVLKQAGIDPNEWDRLAK